MLRTLCASVCVRYFVLRTCIPFRMHESTVIYAGEHSLVSRGSIDDVFSRGRMSGVQRCSLFPVRPCFGALV